jgi:hypothetical protein
VASGAVAASTAYELSRETDADKRQELFAAAANGELTRDEAARHAKSVVPDAKSKSPSRVRAAVAHGTISLSGESLTPDVIVSMLSELLSRARKLRARGVAAETFLHDLRSLSKPKGGVQ